MKTNKENTITTVVFKMNRESIYETIISDFVNRKQQSDIDWKIGKGLFLGPPWSVKRMVDSMVKQKGVNVQIIEEIEDEDGNTTFGRTLNYVSNKQMEKLNRVNKKKQRGKRRITPE